MEDETYLGNTVNLKTTTLSYKNKKQIVRPESEQLRFENTHEPLIDPQTWEIVQSIRQHKRRPVRFEEPGLFSGLAYTQINKLTPEILHTFIERIEIGEREQRYSRTAPQEIRIIYRDIGLVDEMPETMRAQTKEKAEPQTISA